MAIKISGTSIINDNRGLENITNLKTVGGLSILGSGDIPVGGTLPAGTIYYSASPNPIAGFYGPLTTQLTADTSLYPELASLGLPVTNPGFTGTIGGGVGSTYWFETAVMYANNSIRYRSAPPGQNATLDLNLMRLFDRKVGFEYYDYSSNFNEWSYSNDYHLENQRFIIEFKTPVQINQYAFLPPSNGGQFMSPAAWKLYGSNTILPLLNNGYIPNVSSYPYYESSQDSNQSQQWTLLHDQPDTTVGEAYWQNAVARITSSPYYVAGQTLQLSSLTEGLFEDITVTNPGLYKYYKFVPTQTSYGFGGFAAMSEFRMKGTPIIGVPNIVNLPIILPKFTLYDNSQQQFITNGPIYGFMSQGMPYVPPPPPPAPEAQPALYATTVQYGQGITEIVYPPRHAVSTNRTYVAFYVGPYGYSGWLQPPANDANTSWNYVQPQQGWIIYYTTNTSTSSLLAQNWTFNNSGHMIYITWNVTGGAVSSVSGFGSSNGNFMLSINSELNSTILIGTNSNLNLNETNVTLSGFTKTGSLINTAQYANNMNVVVYQQLNPISESVVLQVTTNGNYVFCAQINTAA